MSQLRLGGILWIPAGRPRHRAPPVAGAEQRLAMVRLAIVGHPEYQVDDTEAGSAEPSYTVPTLERVRRVVGEKRPLVLLMGADAFLGLASWHRWRELFVLAHVAVVSRPTFILAAEAMNDALADEFRHRNTQFTALASAPAGAIVTYTMEAGTVSSTEVRARLRENRPVEELLPATVLDYIHCHRLYLS
jgi:nicotinate-nucleotide adenylyltransferase